MRLVQHALSGARNMHPGPPHASHTAGQQKEPVDTPVRHKGSASIAALADGVEVGSAEVLDVMEGSTLADGDIGEVDEGTGDGTIIEAEAVAAGDIDASIDGAGDGDGTVSRHGGKA